MIINSRTFSLMSICIIGLILNISCYFEPAVIAFGQYFNFSIVGMSVAIVFVVLAMKGTAEPLKGLVVKLDIAILTFCFISVLKYGFQVGGSRNGTLLFEGLYLNASDIETQISKMGGASVMRDVANNYKALSGGIVMVAVLLHLLPSLKRNLSGNRTTANQD